jgi:DNA invertase Pin-like site-specific DNA recombinase
MVKVGYLRVSTQEQRPDRQVDGLRSRCDRLFIEAVSAVRRNRPVYEAVIEDLRPGDTLVVWDLDRAFRSVIDAVTEAERLRAKGIEFEIANLQVDTATPAGMLVYTVMSAFAEFERRTLIQRTKEGLETRQAVGTAAETHPCTTCRCPKTFIRNRRLGYEHRSGIRRGSLDPKPRASTERRQGQKPNLLVRATAGAIYLRRH